ncbi:Hypothetical protein A7982_03702 [Minicystis rosea]|nr:Hypothetical protein A7982_03702 [Minicystis rosea]
MKKDSARGKFGRRRFAGGATAALGTSLLATPSLAGAAKASADTIEHVGPIPLPEGIVQTPGIRVDTRAQKPIYLPAADASLAAHAVSEILFWTDQLMEHALFFTLLMPGDRLRAVRQEARQFQLLFAQNFLYARNNAWRDGALAPLLAATQSSVRQLIDYKRRMQRAQESGVLQSLVWPLFFDHVAREAERFATRLQQMAQGNAALQLDEVSSFWTEIMAEHLEFVAHLLDPEERALIAKATAKAEVAHRAHEGHPSRAELVTMADEIIDFKTAAEQGIDTGKIKSIIDPALADHVLREAVKFSDEVKRS